MRSQIGSIVQLEQSLGCRNQPQVHLEEQLENPQAWRGSELSVTILGNWPYYRAKILRLAPLAVPCWALGKSCSMHVIMGKHHHRHKPTGMVTGHKDQTAYCARLACPSIYILYCSNSQASSAALVCDTGCKTQGQAIRVMAGKGCAVLAAQTSQATLWGLSRMLDYFDMEALHADICARLQSLRPMPSLAFALMRRRGRAAAAAWPSPSAGAVTRCPLLPRQGPCAAPGPYAVSFLDLKGVPEKSLCWPDPACDI